MRLNTRGIFNTFLLLNCMVTCRINVEKGFGNLAFKTIYNYHYPLWKDRNKHRNYATLCDKLHS